MAQQYDNAVEALEDPELRASYAREQRNFMKELVAAANKHPTKKPISSGPVSRRKFLIPE